MLPRQAVKEAVRPYPGLTEAIVSIDKLFQHHNIKLYFSIASRKENSPLLKNPSFL